MSVYFSGAAFHLCYSYKEKAITIMGLGSTQGCEMLRTPHYLDNQLTNGGKVVSLMHQPRFTL
jgi:hypothetical protein